MSPSPRRLLRSAVSLGCCSTLALVASRAAANPRPLPFSYPYETIPADEIEIEQYIDVTPVRVLDAAGEKVWDQQYLLQTELEYGLSDRLELGLYMVFENEAGGPLAFDGLKQRLRLRLAEQGDWPVDVALYGELAEFHDEFEFEEKLILARRFGTWRAMANLWFEQSLEHYEGELEARFHPTGGITNEITPSFHLGVEYWGVTKFENDAPRDTIAHFNDNYHHYVGPAVMLQFGKLWWTTGAYLRLDQMDRASVPGDVYGHAWVRTVVALSL